ncbi:hypothetical protein C7447_102107 [Tenacibaculum adriaticum]|uniref:Phosphate-selective porin O/P n=1 Tax=Tenacibaculum adriaticum TaxID=413713 RepID=A0A5S5DVJ2_9FLAO|nr:autotransporter outer membrane beta-barrel domain-containing protein [Tenacibaculum adriaticum]TYP98792.1 hypothetical protein C7447_102107 [Tenacibaculum adriaticum]
MKIKLLLISLLLSQFLISQNDIEKLKQEIKAELKAELLKQDSIDKKNNNIFNNFQLKGYGVVNYYNYDWDTDKTKRNAFDTERLNLYLMYNFNDKIQLKAEFEFEHGGTGATKELDIYEEFGEYENEIEKGGEVALEQLNVLFKYKKWLNFRVGRLKLYMGNGSKLDRPTQYVTGYRSQMENTILPMGWYENGFEILGDFGNRNQWSYKLFFVNGLNSEEFSSANWILRGQQKKFETINAESMAVSFRLDYNLSNKGFVGISGYFGDSNKNRTKPKLDNVSGNVSIIDAHTNVDMGDFKFRGMFLYGHLQNSDKISDANNNLPNALEAKRTPVAKTALGYYASAMYNILPLISQKTTKQQLYLFTRYDFYDTMHTTKVGYFDNPRWERSEITFGVNYFITPKIVFKGHYAINSLGTNQKERTFLTGIGFNIN